MPDDICIKGRFGGHDVDLTISIPTEDEKTPGNVQDLEDPTPDAPADEDAPQVKLDASAEGERVAPADPPPDEIERDEDVPPNPDGNAEQL